MYNSVLEFQGFDAEDFDGFSFRKWRRINPVKRAFNVFKAARNAAIQFDGENDFSGYSEEDFDGFSFKKLNPFQRHTKFGKLIDKVANIASIVPGVGGIAGALTQKLFDKGEVQAAPEAAVQIAQTPAQATAVVSALNPTLTGASQAAAVRDVMAAQTPAQAAAVANAVTTATPDKKMNKWVKIGAIAGGALILIFLIIWLVKRK